MYAPPQFMPFPPGDKQNAPYQASYSNGSVQPMNPTQNYSVGATTNQFSEISLNDQDQKNQAQSNYGGPPNSYQSQPGMLPPGVQPPPQMPMTGQHPSSLATTNPQHNPNQPTQSVPGTYGQYNAYSQPPPPNFGPTMGNQPTPPVPGQFGGYAPTQAYNQPGVPPGSQPAPSQSRSLDPNSMPSVVQVIEKDRDNVKQANGMYYTGQRDVPPPLVTSDFVAQDQGTCSPRFLRSTLYAYPSTSDILKQLSMPVALAIEPFAALIPGEQPIYTGDFGSQGPLRCVRCKAYMSPLMTFIDGGRRFQCNLCGGNTDVPQEYFQHLDHTGRRVDYSQRPELCMGSYELTTTMEYCRDDKLPAAPAFIFVIDVSYASVRTGLLHLICQQVRTEILPYLARQDESSRPPRVGFITYDRVLHFYNLDPRLSKPKLAVVADLTGMMEGDGIVPLVDGFLVDVEEAASQIESLFEILPVEFQENQERSTMMGPAIRAAAEALKSQNRPGKLFVFQASLPTTTSGETDKIANKLGLLKSRDDRSLIGTDREKTIFQAAGDYYTNLGQFCVTVGVGVDLFLLPNTAIDLATLSELPRITGGHIYKYNYFQADKHGSQLMSDLRTAVQGPAGFDGILRVRTSAGTRPVDFWGHFHMDNTTDVQLAMLDNDTSICSVIKHDDKLTEGDSVYIQIACLYTNLNGDRKIRIHNYSMPVSSSVQALFKLSELDPLMLWSARSAVRTMLTSTKAGGPGLEVRADISKRCTAILASYRRTCAGEGRPGELILPEVHKLLPLLSNCLGRCDAFQSDGQCISVLPPPNLEQAQCQQATEITTDDRAFLLFMVSGMTTKQCQALLYPRLIPLHEIDGQESDDMPGALRCSFERLSPEGTYLLENGVQLLMWIGYQTNPAWLNAVFATENWTQINSESSILPELDNPISQRVHRLIAKIRIDRSRFLQLRIIKQGEKMGENWFRHFMVEDRQDGSSGGPSYVDYLCHIHKEIRAMLNH